MEVELYNLFITSQAGQWGKSAYEYELGRAVREYTDGVISEKYSALDKAAIAELMSFPSTPKPTPFRDAA